MKNLNAMLTELKIVAIKYQDKLNWMHSELSEKVTLEEFEIEFDDSNDCLILFEPLSGYIVSLEEAINHVNGGGIVDEDFMDESHIN